MTANVKSFREQYGAELDDRIAAIASDPEQDEKARQAARERAETDRVARHRGLADVAAQALRGDWGKEAQASVTRVLAGATPLRAPMASLVMCESIVREAKQRKRSTKGGAGRGAK